MNTELLQADDLENIPELNSRFSEFSAKERVAWAFEHCPETHILSSSFGIQSAVMLHLVVSQRPNIPVVLTDTGYLFDETYQFIDTLTRRFDLNLKVYRAPLSAAWQEARYGKLWEQGIDGINKYNQLNKVEPMQRALRELQVGTWFTGLRRDQSDSRQMLDFVEVKRDFVKINPILDWSNRDCHFYMKANDLPYHPLWEQGYVSMGDWHTTRKLEPGMTEQDTRFFGLKRECGLHEFESSKGFDNGDGI